MALAREAGLTEAEFSITSFNHFNDTIPIIINRAPRRPRQGRAAAAVVPATASALTLARPLRCSLTARAVPHGGPR
jgi:hypothetical protein